MGVGSQAKSSVAVRVEWGGSRVGPSSSGLGCGVLLQPPGSGVSEWGSSRSSGGHGERGSGSGRAIGWLSCSSSGRGRPGQVGAEQEGVEVAFTRTGCGVRGGAPRNRLGLSRRRDPGDWGAAVGACGRRRQGWPSPRNLHVPVSLCKLSIGRTFLPRALRGLESF